MLLGLLFTQKKKKLTLEETVATIQQGDIRLQNELIENYKPFISKIVSKVCKRYINETNDEFSIGMIAFNEAIQKFNHEKGTLFLSYAEIIVRNRVIDYIRQNAKHQHISMEINEFDNNGETSTFEAELSIDDYRKQTEESSRREEIIQFSKVLKEFGLTFEDLVNQSPKHADARRNAILIAKTIVQNEDLKNVLLEKKRVPIKQLESMVRVSKKTIERNRKYIIAISLVLIGEYVYLKDYIKGVLET